MARISKKTIKNLREFMNRGCDYSGTQEMVDNAKLEILQDMGSVYSADEVGLTDGEKEFGVLDDFANAFWDKAVEMFLNVLLTEE